MPVYCWDPRTRTGSTVTIKELRERAEDLRAAKGTVWIDLEDPTEEEEQVVFRDLWPVHTLTLEDITKQRQNRRGLPHFPKVEEFPDYLFLIVNPLALNLSGHGPPADEECRGVNAQMSFVLNHHGLISHHYQPLASIRETRAFMARHDASADRGPDYICHLILDAMVDEYAPLLDQFDERLDALEENILDGPQPGHLREMVQLKRQLIAIRKTLVYEREALSRMSRGEFDLIDERERVYYRNVYDHLVRFSELIEASRDMIADMMQLHLESQSHKLNEIMKVLTMISTVVLPMNLIAGVYGMNFKHMPELEWEFGYPMALGMMLVTGVVSLGFFRWRKWI